MRKALILLGSITSIIYILFIVRSFAIRLFSLLGFGHYTPSFIFQHTDFSYILFEFISAGLGLIFAGRAMKKFNDGAFRQASLFFLIGGLLLWISVIIIIIILYVKAGIVALVAPITYFVLLLVGFPFILVGILIHLQASRKN